MSSVAVADAAAFLGGLVHDAGAVIPRNGAQPPSPAIPELAGAHVALWRDPVGARLITVAGGLIAPLQFADTSPGDTLLQDLGLTNAQPVPNAAVSGELTFPLQVSSPVPRVIVTMGGLQSLTLVLAKPTSIDGLAADLQAKIRAAGAAIDPIYANAIVAVLGSQLLIVPGDLGVVNQPVQFGATANDATTVQELQLQGRFFVRVRVNGAESVDPPQVSTAVSLP